MEKEIIPEQHEGASADIKTGKAFESVEAARAFYGTVKDRLLHVNQWHTYAGSPFSEFFLKDKQSNPKNGLPAEGDYFEIDIPGPGKEEKEMDWVQVQSVVIDEETEQGMCTSITVKPCTNPTTPGHETTHFFDDAASSTFLVRLYNTTVYAEVHGRNEKPNAEEKGFWNTLRNWLVALGGMAGGSKLHWKKLTDGLIEPAIET